MYRFCANKKMPFYIRDLVSVALCVGSWNPVHSRYQGMRFSHNKWVHFDKDFNEVRLYFQNKRKLRKLACLHFEYLFNVWLSRRPADSHHCSLHLVYCKITCHLASRRLHCILWEEKKTRQEMSYYQNSSDLVGLLKGFWVPGPSFESLCCKTLYMFCNIWKV